MKKRHRDRKSIEPMEAQSSYAYCERVTRKSKSSFRFAFGLLAPHKRRATNALYAAMRLTDDIADGPGEIEDKQAALRNWRVRLFEAFEGRYTHRLHAALHDTVRSFGIPTCQFGHVIDGCEDDLDAKPIADYAAMQAYCYRVSCVVGEACVRIWGLRANATFDEVERPARAAGYAFQMTNILRDVAEDRARGRCYLPADELAHFGCDPSRWQEADQQDRWRSLIAMHVDRTRELYRRSEPLGPKLAEDGRAVFTLMSAAYRTLLERIAEAGIGIVKRRVRLSRSEKLKLWWEARSMKRRIGAMGS